MKQVTTGRKSAKPRQPVKHTKTFTACWTCRNRHVKCGEERPECARCLKGGFSCQGYGIRLVWVDPNTQEREQNSRRAIGAPAIYDDDSSFMRVDVLEALDTIENFSAETDDLSAGPFSVFLLDGYDPDGLRYGNLQRAPESSLSNGFPPPSQADPGDAEEEEIETIYSPSTSILSQSDIDSASISFDLSQASTPPSFRHLDLLPRPSEQRELIHHWTSFVSWHLVPVDRSDNPFRSVFTPMALAGLSSPSSQSNGQIALFHALCAASAFSRGQLLNDDSKSLTLAMKHYNLAIMHLRHSLANAKHNPNTNPGVDAQRGSILATITMFSAMDMITGRSSEWRTHLEGGASWLSTIEGNAWDRDKSSSMVYQGYLAIAALCNINLPSTIEVDMESDDFLDERHYVLDRFFGLTRPMLKHIVMMNSLIKRISNTNPDTSKEMLDDLELQLYMQTPETLDMENLDPVSQALTRNHAYVFYYASLIYFQRTLKRRPPEEVQEMVEIAVGHLEAIEVLGGETIGCTLVWPPFIVACECLSTDLQQRMVAWYMMKRRHGFKNLDFSKDIAEELWRRRSETSPAVDIQWQDVLKEMKMDIVLA
ncbi:arginine metabolism regulation protein II [Knufia peltigerae]|uniref:Arginine metabolism regulation protein II n=1 Tax=Knufia peltigerae TaxID=1002370 RepID=A0AA38XZH2_9EURO|nr:arginine metabolism regulation protein II [Knufia peltigerae]